VIVLKVNFDFNGNDQSFVAADEADSCCFMSHQVEWDGLAQEDCFKSAAILPRWVLPKTNHGRQIKQALVGPSSSSQ
jgi:hypothetical protein